MSSNTADLRRHRYIDQGCTEVGATSQVRTRQLTDWRPAEGAAPGVHACKRRSVAVGERRRDDPE
eukprot:6183129-Pleurochrysis_carterae.AAC.1